VALLYSRCNGKDSTAGVCSNIPSVTALEWAVVKAEFPGSLNGQFSSWGYTQVRRSEQIMNEQRGKPSRAETPMGMGGNIDQTFRFTIPLDEARKRANQ
jgi:hypothetical protein